MIFQALEIGIKSGSNFALFLLIFWRNFDPKWSKNDPNFNKLFLILLRNQQAAYKNLHWNKNLLVYLQPEITKETNYEK